MDNHSNYLYYERNASYPQNNLPCNPSSKYPEYPWGEADIASQTNYPYSMVRQCFIGMKYDQRNFGSSKWNPLGELIGRDETVLVKPNWVADHNHATNEKCGIDCLVTHPSIVRAVLDYVVIALNGTGRIIIGDAPMQGTNLEELLRVSGYNFIFDFYKAKGLKIEVVDLRKYYTSEAAGHTSAPISVDSKYGEKIVYLNELSMHARNNLRNLNYKVSDYPASETSVFHHDQIHAYSINQVVLDSDVVISLPKPKTHRLAGITGGMKNFIGIVYDKASLPHRTQGDKQSGAGDSFNKKSTLKNCMEALNEYYTRACNANMKVLPAILSYLEKGCFVLAVALNGDPTRVGGWYGNDTIWRTIIDVDRIVLFSDKYGKIQEEQQRKIVTIGDMIICGQKDGPVSPTPKMLGVVLIADNVAVFDNILCKIMGFNKDRIPSVDHSSVFWQNPIYLNSNIPELCGDIDDIHINPEWKFEPHSAWKGYL